MAEPASDPALPPDDDGRWRAPTWRDAVVALATAALGLFAILPLLLGPTGRALGKAVAIGPDVVRREVRVAGGVAAPAALVTLALRLRRRSVALVPGERHTVHAAAVLMSGLAAHELAPATSDKVAALGVAALVSVALGPWLLAPTWARGAWHGAKVAALLVFGGAGVAALSAIGLYALPGALLRLLGFDVEPAWSRAWFDLVAPLCLGALLAATARACVAEYDGMPDRPFDPRRADERARVPDDAGSP